MKTKYLWLIAGFVMCQGIANADMITGNVTNIDTINQKMTLKLRGSNNTATIRLADKTAVANLQMGSQVTVDAIKEVTGDWSANTVELQGISRAAAAKTGTANAY